MNVAIKSISEQRDFVVSSSSLKEVRSFSREVFEKSPILKELGVTIDPSRPTFVDAMRMESPTQEGQAARNQRFKDLRRMSDEGSIVLAGRCGDDFV